MIIMIYDYTNSDVTDDVVITIQCDWLTR